MSVLNDKKITLGVTASIAIYRACDLVRLLQKEGGDVYVIMTPHATQLISPQVFRSLSGHVVKVEMFAESETYSHINFAQSSDLFLIAPATANFLGKAAGGIADDTLSTTFVAMDKAKTIVAPAMNFRMYENELVQDNIKKLIQKGYRVLGTERGSLACGEIGQGRFPSLDTIVEECKYKFEQKDLAGKKILITAGPTQEALDPVRYLSNTSSGLMGYSLAQVAWRRGATVTLVSGPTELKAPYGVEMIAVRSALDMEKTVKKHFTASDCFIGAAAVSDFRPRQQAKQKIKKSQKDEFKLDLTLNPDILLNLSEHKKSKQILIGFALESESLMSAAEKKLEDKKLDLLIANEVEALGKRESKVVLMDKKGIVEALPKQSKEQTAYRVLDKVVRMFAK